MTSPLNQNQSASNQPIETEFPIKDKDVAYVDSDQLKIVGIALTLLQQIGNGLGIPAKSISNAKQIKSWLSGWNLACKGKLEKNLTQKKITPSSEKARIKAVKQLFLFGAITRSLFQNFGRETRIDISVPTKEVEILGFIPIGASLKKGDKPQTNSKIKGLNIATGAASLAAGLGLIEAVTHVVSLSPEATKKQREMAFIKLAKSVNQASKVAADTLGYPGMTKICLVLSATLNVIELNQKYFDPVASSIVIEESFQKNRHEVLKILGKDLSAMEFYLNETGIDKEEPLRKDLDALQQQLKNKNIFLNEEALSAYVDDYNEFLKKLASEDRLPKKMTENLFIQAQILSEFCTNLSVIAAQRAEDAVKQVSEHLTKLDALGISGSHLQHLLERLEKVSGYSIAKREALFSEVDELCPRNEPPKPLTFDDYRKQMLNTITEVVQHIEIQWELGKSGEHGTLWKQRLEKPDEENRKHSLEIWHRRVQQANTATEHELRQLMSDFHQYLSDLAKEDLLIKPKKLLEDSQVHLTVIEGFASASVKREKLAMDRLCHYRDRLKSAQKDSTPFDKMLDCIKTGDIHRYSLNQREAFFNAVDQLCSSEAETPAERFENCRHGILNKLTMTLEFLNLDWEAGKLGIRGKKWAARIKRAEKAGVRKMLKDWETRLNEYPSKIKDEQDLYALVVAYNEYLVDLTKKGLLPHLYLVEGQSLLQVCESNKNRSD